MVVSIPVVRSGSAFQVPTSFHGFPLGALTAGESLYLAVPPVGALASRKGPEDRGAAVAVQEQRTSGFKGSDIAGYSLRPLGAALIDGLARRASRTGGSRIAGVDRGTSR